MEYQNSGGKNMKKVFYLFLESNCILSLKTGSIEERSGA